MSAALRLDESLETVAVVGGGGRLVRRVCGCGHCGVVFETVIRRGQGRIYAIGCSFRAEQLREQNRASMERTKARLSQSNPRRCHCGCGKVLPPRVWYHPECKERAQATRERDGARDRPPEGGQRCRLCEGMSHRRPELGCTRCGGAYAPETIKRREPAMASALGFVK